LLAQSLVISATIGCDTGISNPSENATDVACCSAPREFRCIAPPVMVTKSNGLPIVNRTGDSPLYPEFLFSDFCAEIVQIRNRCPEMAAAIFSVTVVRPISKVLFCAVRMGVNPSINGAPDDIPTELFTASLSSQIDHRAPPLVEIWLAGPVGAYCRVIFADAPGSVRDHPSV